MPLLDQAAVIAAMAYVDLKPIRATMADRPEAATTPASRTAAPPANTTAGLYRDDQPPEPTTA